jgi:G3E family GTPase
MTKLPIFILTGFLGSGKTTLLNATLREPAFADTAVVVNEFGEIGLDHLLVTSSKENVVLLGGGCLCCTVIDSLKETLADLYHRRARGMLPPFARIIIETSGLADPTPILQQLMKDSLLSHLFALRRLVCIVDAVFGLGQLDDHPEAGLQAALADQLWITKTDLTGGQVPAALSARLLAVNPTAVREVVRTGANVAALLDGPGESPWPLLPPWPMPPPWSRMPEFSAAPRHDAAIGSHSFWISEPVSWAGLAAWIDWLKDVLGDRLLRCKALFNVAGARGPVLVHGVRSLFETRVLPVWPSPERRSAVVVIGRDIGAHLLQSGLERLRTPAAMASHA